MVLGRGPAQLLQAGKDLLGLLRVAGSAQGTRTMKLGILGVISELGRVGEGLRGVVVLLQVLERQALEEEGHPRFTGPLQVFQPRAVPAQEHLAHPQAEISLGLRILLLPLANIGHGIAERPVTRGVAAQHLAQIRHRGNIKRRPVHDRADVGGHHLGHAINSPITPPRSRDTPIATASSGWTSFIIAGTSFGYVRPLLQ